MSGQVSLPRRRTLGMSAFAAASSFFHRPQKIQTEAAGLEFVGLHRREVHAGQDFGSMVHSIILIHIFHASHHTIERRKSKTVRAKTRVKITCYSDRFHVKCIIRYFGQVCAIARRCFEFSKEDYHAVD